MRYRPAVGHSLILCLLASLAACDDRGPIAPDGAGIDIVQSDARLLPGQKIQLVAVDASGADVSSAVSWSAADASTVTVSGGLVDALAAGATFVRAERGGSVDSARVVVSFNSTMMDGLLLRLQETGSTPLGLTGVSFLHDRLDSDGDHFTMVAVPGSFDPETPPGIEFDGTGTRFHISLSSLPVLGTRALPSWVMIQREDGGFGFEGSEGIFVWDPDQVDPTRAELYVSVGSFTIEVDRIELPHVAGAEAGVLVGRLAFDAAGLDVLVPTDGPPAIVGQISTETVPVFAEFSVAIRLFPIGFGSIGIEGGPSPVGTIPVGAPRVAEYADGLLLDYSIALPTSMGDAAVFVNQVWIGDARVGQTALDEAGPSDIQTTDSYLAGATWAWTGMGADPNLVSRGLGQANAFSSGGTLTVTEYLPASADAYGLLVGSFDIPQNVYLADGTTSTQTLSGDFTAPINPTGFTSFPVLPPGEIVAGESAPPDSSSLVLGSGSHTLNGRTLEDDYLGVAGVSVTISGPSGTGTVVSNALGRYSVRGLEPGDYTVAFDVPPGHQLAEGQSEMIAPLRIGATQVSHLDLHLADAEGNGSLSFVAGDVATGTLVNGVTLLVRDASSDDLVLTLVSGAQHMGQAISKLASGSYEVEIGPTDGYRLADDMTSPVEVRVRGGHLTRLVVRLESQ